MFIYSCFVFRGHGGTYASLRFFITCPAVAFVNFVKTISNTDVHGFYVTGMIMIFSCFQFRLCP